MDSDCEQSRKLLYLDPIPESVQRHLDGCADCGAWLDDSLKLGAAARQGPAEAVAGLAELESLLATESGLAARMRSMATALRARLWLLVMLTIACLQLLLVPRADVTVYPLPRLGLELLLHVLILGAASAALLRPAHKREWPKAAVPLIAAAALCLPMLIALTSPAHTSHVEALRGAASNSGRERSSAFAMGRSWGCHY